MDLKHKTDSNYESAEDGSEYFSVTDNREETQFQQSKWDDGAFVDHDNQNENENIIDRHDTMLASRRSIRIMKNKGKYNPSANVFCFRERKEMAQKSGVDICPKITGKKLYQCKTCSKSFPYRSSLNMHNRIHTGEKPFNCSICLKSFLNPSNFKVHIRIHTGEKPHACVTCSKSFSTSSKLKRHIRTHTGERPYQCQTCLKSFSQSSILILHTRTHTGEKPYECSTCFRSFLIHQISKCTLVEFIIQARNRMNALLVLNHFLSPQKNRQPRTRTTVP